MKKFREVSMGEFFVLIGQGSSSLFHQEGGDAAVIGQHGSEAVGAYKITRLGGGGYATDPKPTKIGPDVGVQLVQDYFA